MRSRRGGYVGTPCSHHPARLRGHPSSGRRGIHFVRRSKAEGRRMKQGTHHSSLITHHSVAIALLCAVALAGCALGYTSVREIKAKPEGYMGKEVRLHGTARRADAPGRANAYLLRDGTGEIMVVTRGELPVEDSEVALKGILKGVVSRGAGWSLELRVEETQRLR